MENKKKKKKKENRKRKRKKEGKKKGPNSRPIPPWKVSKLPQERWMGVHTGNHRRLTRCPVSSFGFGPHYRLPAFWLPGPGRRESNVYGVAQTRTRLLGRQMFRTPVCKRTRHLDFPPKLRSNSIFKPQPSLAGWNGARPRTMRRAMRTRTHTAT